MGQHHALEEQGARWAAMSNSGSSWRPVPSTVMKALTTNARSTGKARPWFRSMPTRSERMAPRSNCLNGTPWY